MRYSSNTSSHAGSAESASEPCQRQWTEMALLPRNVPWRVKQQISVGFPCEWILASQIVSKEAGVDNASGSFSLESVHDIDHSRRNFLVALGRGDKYSEC